MGTIDARSTDDKVQALAARLDAIERRQIERESKRRDLWLKMYRALMMVAAHIKDDWGLK